MNNTACHTCSENGQVTDEVTHQDDEGRLYCADCADNILFYIGQEPTGDGADEVIALANTLEDISAPRAVLHPACGGPTGPGEWREEIDTCPACRDRGF